MRTFLTSLAVVLSTAASFAQSPAPPTDPLKPLAFLAGSCWIGPFPDGKSTDEHCFEWMFDGKFLRDLHIVTGAAKPYAGESVFGWDAKEKKVTYWYFNSLGNYSVGTAEFTPDGILFPERHVTEKGVIEMKALWRRDGADAYTVTQQRREGDTWKTLWTMRLIRKKP
jgi:hypothetical protein